MGDDGGSCLTIAGGLDLTGLPVNLAGDLSPADDARLYRRVLRHTVLMLADPNCAPETIKRGRTIANIATAAAKLVDVSALAARVDELERSIKETREAAESETAFAPVSPG